MVGIGSVLLLLTLLNCQSFLPCPVHSVFSCIDCVLYHWVCVRDDHHTVRKEKEEPKEPTIGNGREEVEFRVLSDIGSTKTSWYLIEHWRLSIGSSMNASGGTTPLLIAGKSPSYGATPTGSSTAQLT